MSSVRSIRINEDLRSRLEAFANRHQRTPNFVINEALQTYLEMREQEEAVIEAAKEAWTEFKAERMGVGLSEVSEWLNSWGGPSEKPGPEFRKL